MQVHFFTSFPEIDVRGHLRAESPFVQHACLFFPVEKVSIMNPTAKSTFSSAQPQRTTRELVTCGHCYNLLELPAGLGMDRAVCPTCYRGLRRSTDNRNASTREVASRSNLAVVQPFEEERAALEAPGTLDSNLQGTQPKYNSSLFLIGGLLTLILGLTIAVVVVRNNKPEMQASNGSTDLVNAIRNDVDRMQAEVDASRLQLEKERRVNDKLEQERTDLLLELNKLEKATSL